jgi:hypothetical protein
MNPKTCGGGRRRWKVLGMKEPTEGWFHVRLGYSGFKELFSKVIFDTYFSL